MGIDTSVHRVKSVTLSKIRKNGGVEKDGVLSRVWFTRDIAIEFEVSRVPWDCTKVYKLTLFSNERKALKVVQGGERVRR